MSLCLKAECLDTFHIVVTDCRYANEVKVVKEQLGSLGYRVVVFRIQTEGVGPANEEEAASIAEMDAQHDYDYHIEFAPCQGDRLIESGEKWAKILNL